MLRKAGQGSDHLSGDWKDDKGSPWEELTELHSWQRARHVQRPGGGKE